AIGQAEELLAARRPDESPHRSEPPRSITSAARGLPGANLALVSVPGPHAVVEAHQALSAGLHVFLFSDGVPLPDEVRLKRRAVARGRLLMGPECGTTIVNGVGLGFANRVRRGHVGLVAASGTGLQEVASLIHGLGGGVSQAIGTGGRGRVVPGVSRRERPPSARGRRPGRLLGLYTGGTLGEEARAIVGGDGHEVIDFGDSAYTHGRPHPIIDPSLRNARVAQAGD